MDTIEESLNNILDQDPIGSPLGCYKFEHVGIDFGNFFSRVADVKVPCFIIFEG